MIQEFVERWNKNKDKIETYFKKQHPEEYKDIVQLVIDNLWIDTKDLDWKEYPDHIPNPKIIHEIDDGDYQGTLLYIIPKEICQPSTYYYVFVDYGSCSVCDTLEAIKSDSRNYDDPPNKQQVKDYMSLALHIVQGLKIIEARDS